MVTKEDKPALLAHLLADPAMARVLVFTRTKHGADRVCQKLQRQGIAAAAIHGNKSQNARQRALADFKAGAVRVLAASDIAARGLDIDDVTHVINFDVPNEPETYVHRIGRTGRAGALGDALSLCAPDERGFLRAIERMVKQPIEVLRDHPFHTEAAPVQAQTARPAARPAMPQRHRPHSSPRGGSARADGSRRRW
jgi:ATP-dependent RNA helicase RhlE